MTWIDHGRRTASVLLVVLALLTLPAVAHATFDSRSTRGLTASTAQLVAPTSVTGTYQCVNGFFREGFDVSVADFADAGPGGATYRYSILRGDRVVESVTSTARTVAVGTGNLGWDGTSTRWTLTIQATLRSWTGPVYSRTVTCGVLSGSSGPL